MDRIAAQSMVRFGLGAGICSGCTGRAALKAQLAGPDPGLRAGVFGHLPTGEAAVAALQADRRARHALLAAGTPLKGNVTSQSRAFYQQDSAAQLQWAATTPAGFREHLVWFWANHFSVSASQNQSGGLIGPMIREAIRPNITGTFAGLVLAADRHPAMLRYLDNANSIGPNSPVGRQRAIGLNENLGRECMELHTVGLAAGYTQVDVTSMAKILTGWSAAPASQGGDATGFKYRAAAHEPGPQTVLGRHFDGGEQAGIDALHYLATHPATYQLLARKLVTHFVADQPPADAVAHIATVLADTGGDLAQASAALVDLPAAWVPGQKFKTPFEYVVSMLRAAPPPAGLAPQFLPGAFAKLGQPVWNAPLPNGWPDQAADWAGSGAILARADFAYAYAAHVSAEPAAIADAALGPLLRPQTRIAMAAAGSRREALTLLFTAPEFQRR